MVSRKEGTGQMSVFRSRGQVRCLAREDASPVSNSSRPFSGSLQPATYGPPFTRPSLRNVGQVESRLGNVGI